MRGIASHGPRLKAMGRPKALGSRRSGRAGEPAVGESVRASESLDDVPQDPRLPSCPADGPTDRPRDLYGSLSALLGIRSASSRRADLALKACFGRLLKSDGRLEAKMRSRSHMLQKRFYGYKNSLPFAHKLPGRALKD